VNDALIAEILALLERLVAFDTQNPPRRVDREGIIAFLVHALGPAFRCEVRDLGDGCINLFAARGAPRLLFNVHIDTVPADPSWQRDPHRLVVEGDRAVGLGAADIKGAAACLVAVAKRVAGDVAFLFSTDEEAGSSRCVKAFLDEGRAFDGVVIAEPTRCRAVLEHRGISSCVAEFRGTAGHASAARALEDSALHEAVRWAARALAFAEEGEARRYKNLAGLRFNIGVAEGGTKSNMIASSATLRFGARPLPDQRPEDLLDAMAALAPRASRATFRPTFLAPPLPAPSVSASTSERVDEAARFAAVLGLPLGEPVDFWSEAALFSAAGMPAIVYGPGDIAQAHTAGEWVHLADLAQAAAAYQRILDTHRG